MPSEVLKLAGACDTEGPSDGVTAWRGPSMFSIENVGVSGGVEARSGSTIEPGPG